MKTKEKERDSYENNCVSHVESTIKVLANIVTLITHITGT